MGRFVMKLDEQHLELVIGGALIIFIYNSFCIDRVWKILG